MQTHRPNPGQPRGGQQRSPPVALLLQQAPEGLEVPHIGCIVEPRVLTVLQRMVTKLLPQPLLQIRTCTEERGACQFREALPAPTVRGRPRPPALPLPNTGAL